MLKSIDICWSPRRAHSSKPAAAACGGQMMGLTDRQTDGRPKVSYTLLRILCKQRQYCHTHPFNGPFSETTRVSQYQKGRTDLDFTEARDSEWQWHQLGHMQVCTSLQTDNHANTSPLSFLQAGCPSCRPTNSVKALKAILSILAFPEMFLRVSWHCHQYS